MKKTVFITFFPAYPHRSGAASVSYNIFKYTVGEKWLIQLSGYDRIEKLNNDMTVISVADNSKTKFRKLIGILKQIKKMSNLIQEINPDSIYFEGASWVLYFVLLYKELRRKGINAKYIYHSHNVEYILRKQKYWPIVAIITRWSEKYILTHCDYSTAVSEIDAQQFLKLYDIKPAILPNGIDLEKFDKVTDEQIKEIKEKYRLPYKTVLFMGLIGYKPNDEAVDYLINKIFPELLKNIPEAKLVVIGGKVNYMHPWLINPGNIPPEDVPIFIKACEVCVSPIFSGSGTRLKILEYLAASKPVISTTKGAEGLDIVDKEQIVLADNSDAFINQLSKYLTDDQAVDKLIEKSKDAVKKYDWNQIMEKFQEGIYHS